MLKKLSICLTMIALMSLSTTAEDHNYKTKAMDFFKSLEYGSGLSMTIGSFDNMDAKAGFGFNGDATYKVNEQWSVVTGVGFQQKNAEVTDGKLDYESFYFTVPVLAEYTTPYEYMGFDLKVTSGLFLGYLLSVEMDGTDVKDTISDGDYGLSFGLNTTTDIAYGYIKNVTGGFSYDIGLKDIGDDTKSSYANIFVNVGF